MNDEQIISSISIMLLEQEHESIFKIKFEQLKS